MLKLACCWLAAAEAVLGGPGVELAAVMTPPVILKVVVPGLDKCPAAAVSVLTEPSDNFTCAPCEPTTCERVEVVKRNPGPRENCRIVPSLFVIDDYLSQDGGLLSSRHSDGLLGNRRW